MLCPNCGVEIEPNEQFCSTCGCNISVDEASMSKADPGSKETIKNPSTKLKFMLVLAMACFFFPFVTVSCAGETCFTASGVEAMTAVSLQDEYDFSEFRANIYLLATAALAVIGFVKARKAKSLLISGIATAGATLFLLLFRFKIYDFYQVDSISEAVSIDFRWGWWLSLLFFLEALRIAIVALITSPKESECDAETS